MRSRPRVRALLLLLTITLIAAACGSSDGDDAADVGLATLETSTADGAGDGDIAAGADSTAADSDTTDADSTDEAPATFDDAQLDFAQCLRDSGFTDWPDPDPSTAGGRGGFGNVDLTALGIDRDDADFQAATEECRSSFDGVTGGRGELDPEQQAEAQDRLIELFACIRENPGFEDLPDIDLGGGGLRELITSGDIDIEEFRELSQACQTELGIEGGLGGGPGGRGAGAGAGAGGAGQDG